MSSDDAKQLHKIAIVPRRSGGPKGGEKPSGSTSSIPMRGQQPVSTPSSGKIPTTSSTVATNAIREMQKAMQDLATAVAKYSTKPDPTNPKKTIIDDSKKPFNDFLTEQYLATSDVKGTEYSPDPSKTTKDQKQPTDLIEMDVVIDTLKRIGSSQNELKADSQWDFRTNNALKNIYALADALVRVSQDFGKTSPRSFNKNDLLKMQQLIPVQKNPTQLPADEKIERAQKLTPLIEKLKNFYEFYLKAIATNPAYRGYITGKYKLMGVKAGGEDPAILDDNEKKLQSQIGNLSIGNNAIPNITDQFPIRLPSPKGVNGFINVGSLPLTVLSDVKNLKQFMITTLGYDPHQANNLEDQKKVLGAILNHITQVYKSSASGRS